MKPINICPVKVGQQVRYGGSGQWCTVLTAVYGQGVWTLHTVREDGLTRCWRVRGDDMCGMRVKNETD